MTLTGDDEQVETEQVSRLRDGAVGVTAGTALASVNLLYFLRESAFTQPATWVRVIIVVIAGIITALVWARWMRGRPVGSGSQLGLMMVTPLAAIAMYVGAAQFMIHQREKPVDVTLPSKVAEMERVDLDQKNRNLFETRLLLTQGAVLEHDEFGVEYAMYEDPQRPGADYVMAMVMTAYRGTNVASNLADNFDGAITSQLLGGATTVGESHRVDGAAGRFRCGQVTVDEERVPMCAYAHGVRVVLLFLTAHEGEPERLASTMFASMLSA